MGENKTERGVQLKTGDVANAEIRVAGRDVRLGGAEIASETAPSESTEVTVELGKVEGAQVAVAGRDVTESQSLVAALEALEAILIRSLDGAQIADLKDLIAQLKAEGDKPEKERNVARLKRIVKSVGEYIGLAALIATQAQKATLLLEQIKKLLGI
ncbi:MAG: hypothetical protein DRJ03_30570 [Chloroflexi bacterium]|nr:MAG: hypothetical protein DRJ03_30570 [Chloroflexota bacterium]